MKRKLKFAAYAGIISLIMILPEMYLEEMLKGQPDALWIFNLEIFVYIIANISTVFIYYGFYLIGKDHNVATIVISSIIIVLLNFFWYTYQAFTIREVAASYNIVGGTVLVVFGLSRIVFGYGVFKIRNELGKLATTISVLEVVIGLFLMSIYAYLVGFVLSLAAAVIQIMFLFRLSKTYEEKTVSS